MFWAAEEQAPLKGTEAGLKPEADRWMFSKIFVVIFVAHTSLSLACTTILSNYHGSWKATIFQHLQRQSQVPICI